MHLNGTVIWKFLALKKQKIVGNICFSEQIFYRKQSLGAPVMDARGKFAEHESSVDELVWEAILTGNDRLFNETQEIWIKIVSIDVLGECIGR